jgi:hypothetical protein
MTPSVQVLQRKPSQAHGWCLLCKMCERSVVMHYGLAVLLGGLVFATGCTPEKTRPTSLLCGHGAVERVESGPDLTTRQWCEVEGAREGVFVELANGRLRSVGAYRAGVKDGTWIEYWPEGIVRQIETYRGGLEVGTTTTYFDDGSLWLARSEAADSVLRPQCSFDGKGKWVSAGFSSGGRMSGDWAQIVESKIAAVTHYAADGTDSEVFVPGAESKP